MENRYSLEKEFPSVSDAQSHMVTTLSGTRFPDAGLTIKSDPVESYQFLANYKVPEKSVVSVNIQFFEMLAQLAGMEKLSKKANRAFRKIKRAKKENYRQINIKRLISLRKNNNSRLIKSKNK